MPPSAPLQTYALAVFPWCPKGSSKSAYPNFNSLSSPPQASCSPCSPAPTLNLALSVFFLLTVPLPSLLLARQMKGPVFPKVFAEANAWQQAPFQRANLKLPGELIMDLYVSCWFSVLALI